MNGDEFIGQKFGRLTVTEVLEKEIPNTNRRCIVVCECGKIKELRLSHVVNGATASCGCLKELNRKTHGMSKHPLQHVYTGMRNRCYDSKDISYKRYGGRGIKVCDEWLNDRTAFYNWALSNGYAKGLQLDRMDNDGNYCPPNCRFVTSKVNNNNRSSNVFIEHDGVRKTIAQWAENSNINSVTVNGRILDGWSLEEALHTPLKSNRKYLYNNAVMTVNEISMICGVKEDTIHHRLSLGQNIEEATKPVRKYKNHLA